MVGVSETKAAAVEELIDVLEPIVYHNFSLLTESAPKHLRSELQELVNRHDMQEHGQANASPAKAISSGAMRYLGDELAIAGSADYCADRLDELSSRVDSVCLAFPTRDIPEHAAVRNAGTQSRYNLGSGTDTVLYART